LRIGNIIHFEDVDGQVETKVTWEDLKWASVNEKTFNEFHKPIPLTEEWLLRLGFEFIIDKNGFKALKKALNSLNQDWEMFYEINESKHSFYLINDSNETLHLKHVRHVHSLQNLYFSLSGEELQLNQTT
jgi:hypothetical protein